MFKYTFTFNTYAVIVYQNFPRGLCLVLYYLFTRCARFFTYIAAGWTSSPR